MTNLYQSKVLENKQVNQKFHQLKFKLQGDTFAFQTGQFVVLKVGEDLYRDYSLASTPQALPQWEIVVDVTPGGPGTTYLKQLKPGETVETTSPRGVFTLQEDGAETVILGATGCGISPLKPMIEELLSGSEKKKVCLFWGLRYGSEIFLEDILGKWQKDYPNFDFKIVLSKPEAGWEGESSHVTECVIEMVGKSSKDKTSVYLCGSSEMVYDVRESLAKIDFPHDKIYFERYF
ncbi:MAG: FAD-binding oxidoreductase [bacterium]|nr:FAD-binding oxidoreductase [bacterium]